MDANKGQGLASAANRFTTRSVDEARAVLSQQFYDMKLDTPTAQDFELDADVVVLGGVTIGRMSFGASIRVYVPDLEGYHVVAPMTGSFSIGQGRAPDTPVSARTGGMMNPPKSFRVGDFSPDCDTLTIKVDKAAVHRQLEVLLGLPRTAMPTSARRSTSPRDPGAVGRVWRAGPRSTRTARAVCCRAPWSGAGSNRPCWKACCSPPTTATATPSTRLRSPCPPSL